jgi:hypothetical protein
MKKLLGGWVIAEGIGARLREPDALHAAHRA